MITAAANEHPNDRPIAMETRRVADYLIYRNYSSNKAFLALLSSDLIRKQSDLYGRCYLEQVLELYISKAVGLLHLSFSVF